MRIEDVERIVKLHNDMLAAVAPYRGSDGGVHYQISDSTKAVNAIALVIVREVTDQSSQ